MTSMPMRVVASRGRVRLLRALHAVALGGAEHEIGEGHPLVDPAPVRAPEHALGCARIADPALEIVGLGVLDALPGRQRGGEHSLEQGRGHPLAPSGLLADAERGTDGERRQVARRHAHPRDAGEQRAGPRRRHPAVVGDDEIGERGRDAREPRQRAAGHAPALPLVTGARRHQGLVAGTVGVAAVVAVGRDRAVDEPRVARVQRVEVDAEARRRAGRVALDEHVGAGRERDEPGAVGVVVEVELGAALAPVPDLRSREPARRVAARRFDLGDVGAVVAEEHPGHGPGDPRRQVEHDHTIEHTGHAVPLSSLRTGALGSHSVARRDTRLDTTPLMCSPPFGRRRDSRIRASGARGRRGSTRT